jgi:hypothetical protein
VPKDFDLRALYDALDDRRRAQGISWSELAREVNRHRTTLRPIALSTITGLRQKPQGEGDGILQMILWLGRTPESFVADIAASDSAGFKLPVLSKAKS